VVRDFFETVPYQTLAMFIKYEPALTLNGARVYFVFAGGEIPNRPKRRQFGLAL
jgi:hypothetical protein